MKELVYQKRTKGEGGQREVAQGVMWRVVRKVNITARDLLCTVYQGKVKNGSVPGCNGVNGGSG